MATYLVTGIAGFIGSSVASALLERGHAVVGLDDLSSGHADNVPKGASFIKTDCLDDALYASKLPKAPFDAIFHLAGKDGGGAGPEDPLAFLRANTESTLRLLRFAEESGCGRFLYRSAASVYGPHPDVPAGESDAVRPSTFSGVSRLAAEGFVSLYAARGLRTTILRLFSPYGPAHTVAGAEKSLPALFMDMLFRDRHILVNGSPNRCRDFVYIDDVTAAFLACLDRPQSAGQTVNIGGSGKTMVGDLVDRIAALSEEPVTVEYSGWSEGGDFGVHADISMAAKYLGYNPEVDLTEGLGRMYAWYKARSAK